MAQIIIMLAGGLAIFIYGMQCMGDGLQNLAGDKMKKILAALTSTPLVGVAVGTLVTSIVQSSSLTTVMVVGFVNASLMSLKQAISVIMGANIGTTVTAQLVAFKITEYWALLLAGGFIAYFFFKRKNVKNTGFIFFSLGLLLLGMVTMSSAMEPLRDSPSAQNAILFFSQNRMFGLLVGMAFTAVVQSSSATTGLLIAMANSGLVPLEAALPVMLGCNIGTCVTAMLASIGTSLSARRAALAHVVFNIIGALLFLLLLSQFETAVRFISPADNVARQIANAHTVFNIINTMLVLPFINQFTALIIKMAPGEEKEKVKGVQYLDWHLCDSPELAIDLACKELLHMGDIARENLRLAVEGMVERDERKMALTREQEDVVDEMEKEIYRYLTKVSQHTMSETLSATHTGFLHVANDIERISDHAHNIANLGQGMIEAGLSYSDTAINELREMHTQTDLVIMRALEALIKNDITFSEEVHEEEQKVDVMERRLRSGHMRRLVEGRCSPEAGVLFLDVISNLERAADHADNIANISVGKI